MMQQANFEAYVVHASVNQRSIFSQHMCAVRGKGPVSVKKSMFFGNYSLATRLSHLLFGQYTIRFARH